MKSWEVEGLSIDDKYEIEEFRVMTADAGQVEVVSFLLEQGADMDRLSLDYAAHTPLHLAVTKRHYQVNSGICEM